MVWQRICVDQSNNCIQIFTAGGQYIASGAVVGIGQFQHPRGIAIDNGLHIRGR